MAAWFSRWLSIWINSRRCSAIVTLAGSVGLRSKNGCANWNSAKFPVVFLGPTTLLYRKPVLPLTPRKPGTPEFFDVVYYPPWTEGDEAPDAVAYVTRALDGQIFKIHSPAEFGEAIRKIYGQLAASRGRLAISEGGSR